MISFTLFQLKSTVKMKKTHLRKKRKKKKNKKPHLYHVIMTDGNACPRKSGGFPCLPLFYNFFNEWDHTTQYNLLQNMQPNGSEHLKKISYSFMWL